jgi:hypothetical protein
MPCTQFGSAVLSNALEAGKHNLRNESPEEALNNTMDSAEEDTTLTYIH